jgi:hypothetical protein
MDGAEEGKAPGAFNCQYRHVPATAGMEFQARMPSDRPTIRIQ